MHACHILNHNFHTTIKKTPYEAWGDHKPDLKHMQTFGTPGTVKKSDIRPLKGHPHVYHGIFLCFTRTAKYIVYYGVDTGTNKVATHKLHNEFQYSSDRNKRSHASQYIINMIANDKKETQYGKPMLDGTIIDLIPTDIPLSTAAAATTEAYDMEVETLSPKNVEGFQSDTERLYTYIKGGKHRMLSQPVHCILNQLDAPTKFNTHIVNCTKTISKD